MLPLDEKWSDSKYILKDAAASIADRLDVGVREKEASRKTPSLV